MHDRTHRAHRAPTGIFRIAAAAGVPCGFLPFHPEACAGTAAFRLEYPGNRQFVCRPCLEAVALEKGFPLPQAEAAAG
ncbi:MAG: hypothetical protein HY608_00550 [Planctomycetes bacterium]|nr:hypothetical protein [Planctomycetota bacterium]